MAHTNETKKKKKKKKEEAVLGEHDFLLGAVRVWGENEFLTVALDPPGISARRRELVPTPAGIDIHGLVGHYIRERRRKARHIEPQQVPRIWFQGGHSSQIWFQGLFPPVSKWFQG